MLEVKTRQVAPALLLLAGIALAGCSASQDGPKYPTTPDAVAKFDPLTGFFPYPWDYFFLNSPVADGTLNLPAVSYRPEFLRTALNTLDGWSTSSVITTNFSVPLDPASINGDTVKVIKLYLNPLTKAPVNPLAPVDPNNPDGPKQAIFLPDGVTSPVAGVLAYGTDYVAKLTNDPDAPRPGIRDYDSGGMFLQIIPLKPLEPSRGPAVTGGKIINIGYLVVLTNGLRSTSGDAIGPDTLYASVKPPASCSSFSDATQVALCQITQAHLGLAQLATGTDPATVVLSWSFSTQSIDDTLNYITLFLSPPQQTAVVPAFDLTLGRVLNTHDVNAGFSGKADIYVGSTKLPYYLTPAANPQDAAAVLTKYWTGADGSFLTMFNPAPVKVTDVTVPILVTVPNANSACPGKPAGGWPVAIVQHGITGNRSQALTMSDKFADACFIVASIDLPLHGITDPTNKLYCTPDVVAKPQCMGAQERTFDLDVVNNVTGAAGPDGVIDPSGGIGGLNFFNFPSPLTWRDNLRQGEADLITFTKSVQGLAVAPAGLPAGVGLPPGPVGVDGARVSYVGLSLGAIVGGAHVHFSNDTRTATLAAPGGSFSTMALDSASFRPVANKLVGALLTPDSYLFNMVFRDVQAIVDAGDPINHINGAQTMHPLQLIKVLNDNVVPNSSTDLLIAAGGLRKLVTVDPIHPIDHNGPIDPNVHACNSENLVGPGTGAYTFFSKGSHGSLIDPSTSLAATDEMQRQAVWFAASAVWPDGPCAVLSDASVLDLN